MKSDVCRFVSTVLIKRKAAYIYMRFKRPLDDRYHYYFNIIILYDIDAPFTRERTR